jgi:dolichol-phosphate mannosyltransferase
LDTEQEMIDARPRPSTLADGAAPYQPARFSVVVPTYNEAENVAEVVRRVESALQGVDWEIIFVDDNSPDGTADRVRQIAAGNPHVRCVQRVGRRGLSSACVEGFLASSAPYLAVMDADLQHDERLLPELLRQLESGSYDVAIGSRYVEGGSTGSWEASRVKISSFATKLAHFVTKVDLKDPMSGFFALRRDVFVEALPNLSSIGFKILLDLFASHKAPLRYVETPYQFRERVAGESKLDVLVVYDYLMLLVDKIVGKYVPVRFISFSLIGLLGVVVHMLFLTLMIATGYAFVVAQTVGVIASMTFNFFLNNMLTYRDKRLKGWGMVGGLLKFYAICGFGAVASVGIGSFIFEHNYTWWLSGLAGVLVGAVWNYAVTSIATWNR